MEKRAFAGFSFIACMILGMGIGLVFQSIKVGGAIGFGIGLFLLLLFRLREDRVFRIRGKVDKEI